MGENNITSRFNQIYDATNKQALAFISAKCGNLDDINDILQETYMELYKVLGEKGADYVENEEAFVIRIAKQKVYKHYTFLQKRKADLSLTLEYGGEERDLLEEIPDEMELEESVCNSELVQDIQNYIKKKPQHIRKIFFMRFSLELSIKKIAELMGESESNVKNMLYRTINEIRDFYGKGEAI
ncbi:MAG: sigma-70 family RNA polymerase sigma factor [Ruminococcus sp.]|nr:sigma-70 family RNA polymerase sigma factor [Ruminococcus sp.]